MIRVNLVGTAKKKVARASTKAAGPSALLPIFLVLIVLGVAGYGYYWYSDLGSQSELLSSQIGQAQAQKAQLDAVIKQDQIFEARKKALESRIKIIEGLKRNQVSPVVSLDILGQAIDRTQFVWLSSLDQNNAQLSMNGIGTSVDAIADFVTNLENTRYFRNINLVNAQDAAGNFTFSMTCEFAPPVQVRTPEPPARGGN